jgi:hypothetical protein
LVIYSSKSDGIMAEAVRAKRESSSVLGQRTALQEEAAINHTRIANLLANLENQDKLHEGDDTTRLDLDALSKSKLDMQWSDARRLRAELKARIRQLMSGRTGSGGEAATAPDAATKLQEFLYSLCTLMTGYGTTGHMNSSDLLMWKTELAYSHEAAAEIAAWMEECDSQLQDVWQVCMHQLYTAAIAFCAPACTHSLLA